MQVIPLTSNIEKYYPCEVYIIVGDKKGKAMTDQIMTVNKLRLRSKINIISNENMQFLEYALKLQLNL